MAAGSCSGRRGPGNLPAHRGAWRHPHQGGAGAAHPPHQQSGLAAHDTSSLRCPERRAAAAAGGAPAHQGADPELLRAGEFRHVRGHAVLRPRRRARRTCGWRPWGARSRPTTRCVSSTRTTASSPSARSASSSPAALIRCAAITARPSTTQGLHQRRVLSLGRPDAPAPIRQLHGRGPRRTHQSRRREDQRRGDREPHPAAPFGAKRRLRRHARPRSRRAHVRLRHTPPRPAPWPGRARELSRRQGDRAVQAARTARDHVRLSALDFGKVSKKTLVEMVTRKLDDERAAVAARAG